ARERARRGHDRDRATAAGAAKRAGRARGLSAMPPDDSSAGGDRPRVLVVDDDPLVQRSVRWILEDEGLAVECASDGREAMSLAKRRRPALVLLDMSLPTSTGEQVAAELRALYGVGVPIIVITAG